MRALSIRQPFAELILRGIKTVEYRSIATRIVGERFYIYASMTPATKRIWSRDLSIGDLPSWMLEIAEQLKIIPPGTELPTGVIVGSAVIERVTAAHSTGSTSSPLASSGHATYAWHLTDVERAKTLRKPKRHPQPVWFTPF